MKAIVRKRGKEGKKVTVVLTIVLGLSVGLLSTCLGLGGGIFFVTFLPYLYEGVDHITAIATGLASVFLIVGFNTFRFHQKGLVRWDIVMKLAPSILVSAFLAGTLATKVPNEILILILAGALAFLSFWGFANHLKKVKRTSAPFWKLSLLGTYSGVISGLTGIGSGAVTSTCFFNWNLVLNERVSPTSNAVMMITNLAALFAYMDFQSSFTLKQIGYVRLDLALLLFVASMITAHFGVQLQSRISEGNRRLAIASLLLMFCLYESYRFYQFIATP